ncbi:MAG: hypothetical protein ACUZ8H_03360 [Candidatus Anammoxibacter sp.]
MKFTITQEQIDQVITTLLEVPAKLSFNSIIVLKQLQPIAPPVAPKETKEVKKK